MKLHPLIEHDRRMEYCMKKVDQLQSSLSEKSKKFIHSRYRRLLRYKKAVKTNLAHSKRKVAFNMTEQEYREWLIGHDLYNQIRWYLEEGEDDSGKQILLKQCKEVFQNRMNEKVDWFDEGIIPDHPVTPFASFAKIGERI